MKPDKLLLSVASVLLASSAYITANMAYAEDKESEVRSESRDGKGAPEALAKGVAHAVTLSNLSDITLKEIEISFSGKDRSDFRQTNDCGERLAGKASCTINVTFLPKTAGPKSATMEVRTSGGSQAVYLTGTGM